MRMGKYYEALFHHSTNERSFKKWHLPRCSPRGVGRRWSACGREAGSVLGAAVAKSWVQGFAAAEFDCRIGHGLLSWVVHLITPLWQISSLMSRTGFGAFRMKGAFPKTKFPLPLKRELQIEYIRGTEFSGSFALSGKVFQNADSLSLNTVLVSCRRWSWRGWWPNSGDSVETRLSQGNEGAGGLWGEAALPAQHGECHTGQQSIPSASWRLPMNINPAALAGIYVPCLPAMENCPPY